MDVSHAVARAEQVLEEFGIEAFEQIDLPVLAWGTRLLIQEGPIVSNMDAWMIDRGRMGLARVRDSIPYIGQRRFAMAHEFGHWLLHKGQSQAHLDGPEQFSDYRKSPMEVEANAFAAELLMPRELFLSEFPDGQAELETICSVADRISVGPTAAAMRFLDLAPVEAVMVTHRDGSSLYYVRGERWSLPPILPKTEIPAALMQSTPTGQVFRRQCSAAEWLPGLPATTMLDEQTLWIPDGPAITILSAL